MLLRGGFSPSPRTCRGEERIFSLSSQWQDLSKTDFFVLAEPSRTQRLQIPLPRLSFVHLSTISCLLFVVSSAPRPLPSFAGLPSLSAETSSTISSAEKDTWKLGDATSPTPSETSPLICLLVNGMCVVFRLAPPKKFVFLSECRVVSAPPFPITHDLCLTLALPLSLTQHTTQKFCHCLLFLSPAPESVHNLLIYCTVLFRFSFLCIVVTQAYHVV